MIDDHLHLPFVQEKMSLRDAYHFLKHRRSIADPRKVPMAGYFGGRGVVGIHEKCGGHQSG